MGSGCSQQPSQRRSFPTLAPEMVNLQPQIPVLNVGLSELKVPISCKWSSGRTSEKSGISFLPSHGAHWVGWPWTNHTRSNSSYHLLWGCNCNPSGKGWDTNVLLLAFLCIWFSCVFSPQIIQFSLFSLATSSYFLTQANPCMKLAISTVRNYLPKVGMIYSNYNTARAKFWRRADASNLLLDSMLNPEFLTLHRFLGWKKEMKYNINDFIWH